MNTTAKIQHLEGTDFQKSRGFSPGVVTEGGKTVWLAGQTTTTDLEGKDISGKFDEQARTIFALINRTLERVGGSLANLVTMNVFISDNRNGDRFVDPPRALPRRPLSLQRPLDHLRLRPAGDHDRNTERSRSFCVSVASD